MPVLAVALGLVVLAALAIATSRRAEAATAGTSSSSSSAASPASAADTSASARVPAPAPGGTPPSPPPPSPGGLPSSGSDSGTYYTPPEDAELDKSGWVPFEGMTITALPLRDRRTGLFARLRFHDAVRAGEMLGGRPLTKDELDAIHEAAARGDGSAIELEPVTLVHSAADGMHMASRAWAEKHDAQVAQQLAAKAWNGKVPVSNVGKHWLHGAGGDHVVTNYGWWHDGRPIQTPGTAHDTPTDTTDNHIDYSQLTMLRKDA